jgi:16S rRNA (uracil1498-N3)-methyltransferase
MMEYFYTPQSLIGEQDLVIDGDEFSHLTHVMRRKVGDRIMVVDGAGTMLTAVITTVGRQEARCAIEQRSRRTHEPALSMTLAVGLLKNPASFDFLVEKATELGAAAIVPMITERTIPRHARTDRWQKLALAAMKQSGRCVLPRIHEPMDFGSVMLQVTAELKLIAHERVERPDVRTVVRGEIPSSCLVCIGPEGGFSDGEIEIARRARCVPVSLGPRRLRTETAAVAALALALL